RSSNEGCAPIATPWRRHSATVSRMLASSPAWPPQAMLAEEIQGTMAASSPQPSPRSQLKSMRSGTCASCLQGQRDSMQALALPGKRGARLGDGAGSEAHAVAGPELRQQRPVGADGMADARIAAMGLRIGQQYDRLAVGRQLHAAGRDRFGDALAR